MAQTEVKDLLNAGVHFGHLTRKWNPNMAPYIYMERNGIHIINLYKTAAKIEEAQSALKKIAISGRKILFVATKKQAKDIVAEKVKNINTPYITERWPGGMLTNFVTIRKAVKKMAAVDRMKSDGTFETLSKKEKLQVSRMRAKLEKNLGSITDMTRLPGALFVVDIKRENIAIKEAQKLNIPIFAMVDTDSDPREVDFVIPSNDDASKSIEKILNLVTLSISEGLSQRKNEKDALEKGEGQSSPPVSKTEPEVESAPEKQEATAEKIEDVPEEVKVAPKKVKASPEEANATPEKANATPEKVEALPKVKTVKKKATKKKTISKPKKINSKEKK
ncbi:MAG: 30S ribosomal protein S2 [Flavobacteriaceae bacterium]|nr:30S ribosomal protein S2 [Flavobacteriaceae bacterium]